MGVVIFGKAEEVKLVDFDVPVISWLEDPKLEILMPEDGRPRPDTWGVRHIILHTTKGIPGGANQTPQKLFPGFGAFTDVGVRSATYCRSNPDKGRSRNGGHHLTVDASGQISCHMDLGAAWAYHAHTANRYSIGIEIFQGAQAQLWEKQLHVVAALVDWLTRRFGIQRQIHLPYQGPIARLGTGKYGADCIGVFGHRDATGQRGQGDPGDFIMDMLRARGYEAFDYGKREDLEAWDDRQRSLYGVREDEDDARCDGIAGPKTVEALKAAGYAHGLWVRRPGDATACS